MKKPKARIEYVDSHHLQVTYSYLVIRVASINEKYGAMSDFAEEFNLYGRTNGKLYIFNENHDPHNDLLYAIRDILKPLNFVQHTDYALGIELLVTGKGGISLVLNDELPHLKNSDWLGSILKDRRNYIWSREFEDWTTYSFWRQATFPQLDLEHYQILLSKYYKANDPVKLYFEPTVIEFKGDQVIYGLSNETKFFSINREVLLNGETVQSQKILKQ